MINDNIELPEYERIGGNFDMFVPRVPYTGLALPIENSHSLTMKRVLRVANIKYRNEIAKFMQEIELNEEDNK